MSIKALQDYTYYSKYARYNEKERRRETWGEAVDRVMNMHRKRYPQMAEEIEWIRPLIKEKRFLGSQRALQFGGKPIEKINARIYNCFSRDTEFVTSDGTKSFCDFEDGDRVVVLTHKGNWKPATVRNYGSDLLYPITIRRGNAEYVVRATRNHRWLLSDGSVDDHIEEGDTLLGAPNIFADFDYDESSPDQKLYWAYGFVYGDGTLVKDSSGEYKWSMVRLCDHDRQYAYRFRELGFNTSDSMSLKGDFMAYTETYLKALPDLNKDDPALIRAFVRGYLDADGTKNRNYGRSSPNQFIGIQSSNPEAIRFLRKALPIAGMYITSEKDLTGQKTNYGERGETVFFTIRNGVGKYSAHFRVKSIYTKVVEKDEVWCLEVEDDQSFVLPFGVTTGNCISSYCDRVRFFQECFWLLLCGCGTGFSVQKHHVERIPGFHNQAGQGPVKIFTIPDSIEGWADALGVLLATYFPHPDFPEWAESKVEFDFSLIRPAGSKLSSGVGKAPGPEPLKKALERIRCLLDERLEMGLKELRPIDAYDICMHASDAVLSGGVRRSATLCMFSPDDKDMAQAKTGNWMYDNPQRARSNNSALLLRNETTKEQFFEFINFVKEFGEPGFIWAEDREALFNPSLRSDTKVITDKGIFPIAELKDETVMVKNLNGKWSRAKCRLSGRNKKLFKVNLMGGHSYFATEEHKWPVYSKIDRGYTKKTTAALSPNDLLPVITESFLFEGNVGDYDDGFLVGWLYGDGWITKRKDNGKLQFGLIVSQDDEDAGIFDKLKEILNNKIGELKWTKRESKNANKYWYEVNFQRESAREYFAQFGVYENHKKNGLPVAIWENGTEEFRKGFVDGIISSDGSVNQSSSSNVAELCFSSSNHKLAKDLSELFGFYGIKTTLHQYVHKNVGARHFPNGKVYEGKEYKITLMRIAGQDSLRHFAGLFNISNKKKFEKYEKYVNTQIVPSYQRTIKVLSVEETDIYEDVYDLSVYDNTHCFQLSQCITGNCVEIGMWAYHEDEQGKLHSGWQSCNLCEINGKKIKCKEDFALAARGAAILGTLQAGYTDFYYLGDVSQKIVERESLLGVSLTGMMDNPDVIFDPETQKEMAQLVAKTNGWAAKKIGINPAARCTCVKPAGTTSCVLGTASGIHPHHARRYFRRVQGNILEPVLQYFKEYNPFAIEKSVWAANDTDEVITFCVEVPPGAKTKNQVPALELLEHVKLTQQNWVSSGKKKNKCSQPWLTHNVSNTINIRPDEWDDVAQYIFKNRKWIAGISLIPQSGDLDYPQAPFVTVHDPREILQMYGEGSLLASGLIVDGLDCFNNDLWKACDIAMGLGEPIIDPPKPGNGTINIDEYREWERQMEIINCRRDWVRRVEQFAQRYCEGDVRKCCYLMKEVNNWKVWMDLQREYCNVPYEDLHEQEDNTKPTEVIACAGGACEVAF